MFSTNKKFSLSKFKIIYLMVPANVSTGGPEALHQLGYILKNNLNKNVKVFYIPYSSQNPVHKNYEKYFLEFTDKIEDSSENLIIVPEYFNFLIQTLSLKKIKKSIWWLSIDNYIGSKFRSENSKLLRSFLKIPFNLINFFNHVINFSFGILTIEEYLKFLHKFKSLNKSIEINQANHHLAQSHYAFNYLKDNFENVDYLSDYLRDDILENKEDFFKKKENIICYNPSKSNKFMDLIIKKSTYKFVPLINLTNDQIKSSLIKSKLYMDIGSHPGKDRLPREAALLGNCIITNLKGSAFNSDDIAIPKEFKFSENLINLEKINKKIEVIFDNYEQEYLKFNFYIKKIHNEKKVFIEEINKIFQ